MVPDLSQFPIRSEYTVHWGDMDSARHVNNTVYLRWAESSRISFLQSFHENITFENGLGVILAWQDCKYIFPLNYPDSVLVCSKIKDIEVDRFFIESHIYSRKHDRLAAICNQCIVAYDYGTLKKATLPVKWKEILALSMRSNT